MNKSQWYIGTPNGIVLCIDSFYRRQMRGRFYHKYKKEAIVFVNTEQMLFKFERFFDDVNFPHSATTERIFQRTIMENHKDKKREEEMRDDELLKKHGELGTFVIRVQHREHSSWQGRITWMEKNQTLCFRSIWEMLKLIASAVETGEDEEENEEQTWSDEEK